MAFNEEYREVTFQEGFTTTLSGYFPPGTTVDQIIQQYKDGRLEPDSCERVYIRRLIEEIDGVPFYGEEELE